MIRAVIVGGLMLVWASVLNAQPSPSQIGEEILVDSLSADMSTGLSLATARVADVDMLTIAALRADESDIGADSRLAIAMPLLFGFSVGAEVGFLQLDHRSDWGRLSLLGGYRSGRSSFGVGLNIWGNANDADATVDVGARFRAHPRLLLLFDAKNILGPIHLGPRDSWPMFARAGFALRLFENDSLTLESTVAVDDEREVALRFGLAANLWRFAELRSGLEVRDVGGQDEVRWMVGVNMKWDRFSIGGGARAKGDSLGHYLAATYRATSGQPRRSHVFAHKVYGGARGLLNSLLWLDAARHRDEVKGVVLDVGNGLSSSEAQELRWAIADLRKVGKEVLCRFESPRLMSFYACANASARVMERAGGLFASGPSMEALLYAPLMKKLGVRADFIRIGEYKSYPEAFTRQQLSAPAKSQRTIFLQDVFDRVAIDMRTDDPSRSLDALLMASPYSAQKAYAEKWIDGFDESPTRESLMKEIFGANYRMIRDLSRMPRDAFERAKIGVVIIDGSIVDGDNVDIPLLEIHQSGGDEIIRQLLSYEADASVKAIVVRIDSPGGSAVASEKIWRAIQRVKKSKPVIASLGRVAASGGYYVASAADEIWANPTTLTGSIGIFFAKVDFAGLIEKVGVKLDSAGIGDLAGAESIYRPFSAEERARLTGPIRDYYRLFLSRVAEGRHLEMDKVDGHARGRVFSGERAKEYQLVDQLGGFSAAIARARRLSGLDYRAQIVRGPSRPNGLLDYVLGASIQVQNELEGGRVSVENQRLLDVGMQIMNAKEAPLFLWVGDE